MQLDPIDPESPISLRDEDALCEDAPRAEKIRKKTRKQLDQLTALQARMYGDGRYHVCEGAHR